MLSYVFTGLFNFMNVVTRRCTLFFLLLMSARMNFFASKGDNSSVNDQAAVGEASNDEKTINEETVIAKLLRNARNKYAQNKLR